MFPGDALLTIKNLSLPNLDYAQIVYGKPNIDLFFQKIKTVQYTACIVMPGAV